MIVSHAARCVACHDVRSHAVPVALVRPHRGSANRHDGNPAVHNVRPPATTPLQTVRVSARTHGIRSRERHRRPVTIQRAAQIRDLRVVVEPDTVDRRPCDEARVRWEVNHKHPANEHGIGLRLEGGSKTRVGKRRNTGWCTVQRVRETRLREGRRRIGGSRGGEAEDCKNCNTDRAFSMFAPSYGSRAEALATRVGPLQRLPRRPLCRVPGRALPRGAGRARE